MSSEKLNYSETISDTTNQSSYSFKTLSIAKFDYGPKLMLFYRLSNKISLNLDYYFGLQNMFLDAGSSGASEKNQQFSFGIGYKLY